MRLLRLTPPLLLGAALLAGCSSGDDGDEAGAALPTADTSVTTPGTASTGDSSDGAGDAGAVDGTGCPGPGAGVPSDADSAPTVDVDGDGRPDTLWMEPADPQGRVVFGVTTASAGTFTTGIGSASPAARSALVADVTGDGELVALASDGRQVLLYAISRCELVPVRDDRGAQYAFDLGFTGFGTGVGCVDVDGDGTRDLAGLLAEDSRVEQTTVRLDGPQAVNGASRTVRDASPAQLEQAREVTCGELTLADDGVTSGP